MSNFVVSASSRVGCIRTNNEDMILVSGKMVRSDSYCTLVSTEGTDRFVIALADGMGGHNAGEIASEDALSNLQFFLGDLPAGLSFEQLQKMLVEWLGSINQTIASKGRVNPNLAEMGTTLVGVIYYNGYFCNVNCGDSRLYRFRDSCLTQLTKDHSLNNLMGEKKHSSVITNCIGAGCKSSYFDMLDLTADILPGDVYLLCSDGLNDMVPDEKIEQLLADGADADRLCEAAIEAGGYDNVSVCIMNVQS